MKKIEKIELIIVIVLLVVFGAILIYTRTATKKSESLQIDNTVRALQNENRFFSIDSAISKYITFVASKDAESVIKILDERYIENNNITENNVFNIIENFSQNSKSNTREIYQIKSRNNIYHYYAKVRIEEETIYTSKYLKTVYFKVIIDENKLAFSIEPISETIYLEKTKEATTNE